MFVFYVRDRFAWLERQKQRADSPAFREGGYDAPDRDELMSIPWRGEGDDPLRGMRQ